jgi:flavin-dependent dehydrogenase
VLEREIYPREKVCGDCLNPACWPILDRLQLVERIRKLSHGRLDGVEFISVSGRCVTLSLPLDEPEIAVKRSCFDQLILMRARELGSTVHEGSTVISLTHPATPTANWTIATENDKFEARILIAADGRNSTVARLCNVMPRVRRERVALQAHLPLPDDFGNRVVLQFLAEGYSGQAPVGDGQLNVCLVSTPKDISRLRSWAQKRFGVSPDHSWRTTTPLARAPIEVARRCLFFAGDAARVVEPFTGEGIYYALASGALVADAVVSQFNGRAELEVAASYVAAHAELYRGRLWINRLARAAVLSPQVASALLEVMRFQPALLRFLTAKVVH